MKRFLLLFALIGFHLIVKAQKVYFIYLQSENATPFYVRIGGQIQSSSAEGYLILPKLKDSTYQLSIGQPGKQTEPRFSITINKGDRGFLIRNAEGTITLFDLQTLIVYKPLTTETTSIRTVTRTDNFTRLLAVVADDSTLLSEPVMAVQKSQSKEMNNADVAVVREAVAPAPEVAQAPNTASATKIPVNTPEKVLSSAVIVEKESAAITTTTATINNNTTTIEKPNNVSVPVKDTVVVVENKQTVEAATEQYKKSVVTKKSESSTSEGFGLVFFDEFNGAVDTVALVIPNPKLTFADTAQKQVADAKQFLDISTENAAAATVAVPKKEEQKLNLKAQCASIATDDDFFKLRRDMTAKDNDEEMIAQAKKYFKAKCYRTEQVKYLTALFLTEESKYQFFDAAYMHVSDQEKFKFLQTELKDNYYINRFKALIAN